LADATIIELMSKLNPWLRWALCAFGLGLVVSLSAAAVAGWVASPPAVWWGVAAGLACSLLCTVAGIVLAVRGLMMVKK